MDSSAVSPDGNTSVFCSPDSQNSSPVKFQTSVSVSSLAEKFERSGDFGSVTENNSKVFESNDAPSQRVVESNDNNKSSLQSEKNISLSSDSANKDCDTNKTTSMENGTQEQQQSPDAATDIPTAVQQLENVSCVYCVGLHSTNSATDIPTAVQQLENVSCVYCVGLHSTNFTTDIDTGTQEVKDKNVSCHSCVGLQSSNLRKDISTAVKAEPIQSMNPSVQPSTSAAGISVENEVLSSSQGGSGSPTDAQITKAVEERVAYFVEKISQNTVAGTASSDVPCGEAAKHSSTEPDISGIVKSISLKDLERSFVTALNMANCYEKVADKTADTLPLPSIQITEASDREDSGSDDVEVKTKCEVTGTAVKTPAVEEMEESDAEQDSNKHPIPSTSTATQYENKDGSDISPEERRHALLQDRNRLFYISSSDIPANEPLENSDEIRQQSESVERIEFLGTNPVLVVTGENGSSSCLCSKYVHGITFLTCFIIALAGFILYNLAHEGKVPDFCEYLGLVTAILAGIIGAFSCFCYSILEAFPGIPARYQRMRESRNIQSTNVTRNQGNLDEESWSAEQERAFRIQNGMSSTRTSAASIRNDQSEYLMIRQSDHKELVDKAEKFKKDVVGLLDSFSDVMAEIKLIDKVGKLEAGVENGF